MGLDQYLNRVNRKLVTREDVKNFNRIHTVVNFSDHYIEVAKNKINVYEMSENPYIEFGRINLSKTSFKELTESTDELKIKKYKDALDNQYIGYKKDVEEHEKYKDLELSEYEFEEIGYWRKFYLLDKLVEDMYREENKIETFNCIDVIMTKERIEDLIEILNIEKEDIYHDLDVDEIYRDNELKVIDYTLKTLGEVLATTNFEKQTILYSNWW